jgi:Ni,Fe-hydrogenase III large subunit/Ni,Fe-hydrogenase III component G
MQTEKIKNYISKHVTVEYQGNTAIFEVPASEIIQMATELYGSENISLKLITATDERKENGCFKVWYVFGVVKENLFIIPYIKLQNTEDFPSLSPTIHEAWNYEKKIRTFFGLTAVGHPDTRKIILHENWPSNMYPLRKDFDIRTRPKEAKGTYQFQKVSGEGVYEIPVGPIHAGIIEPGHFRFSVAGESIVLLEPLLGYTHKGTEKLFETLPLPEKIRLSEKVSGDSSFTHSLAFCQALEEISDTKVEKRQKYLRVFFAELERLANHIGDIGAIMTDAGFNFGGAHGARLRENILQINEKYTDSRFLRGINTIGGVTKNISKKEVEYVLKEIADIRTDFLEVMSVADTSASLLNRLKSTGAISLELAKNHGALGIVAKSLGIEKDARVEHPYAAYDEVSIGDIPTETSGDVYARFRVRVREVYASIRVIEKILHKLPQGTVSVADTSSITLRKNAVAVSIVEGWRGEIAYFVTTDSQGNISRVAPRDPSFINWNVLGHAGLNNIVPDFPLINKSFNQSYTGFDL